VAVALSAAALSTVAAVVAGCGSQSSSLAAGDAARLHQDVAGIRSAVAGHNPQAAVAAVRTFQADVARLQATGRLAQSDAAVLLSDAGQVDHRVALEVHAPTPQAPAHPGPAAPAGAPAPPAGPPSPGPGPGPGGKPGKDHGKHTGNNGGGGDGGDGGD
jgi:hypothetical protein